MSEKQLDNLCELLSACHSMLDGAEAGFVPGSPYHEVWKQSRDDLLKEIEKALTSTAEVHPY